MNVAYIGLGSMGGDQARLIAASEHDLTVYDVFEKARESFRDLATVADSIESAVADADVVQVCVRDMTQVEDVLFGEGRVASCAKPGTLVLVHSTIDLASVKSLAERLQDAGLRFADAPITRTRQESDDRFVLTMFGGDVASFEEAQPVLDTFSTDVLHVGDHGAAMALKIANNMMTWTQLVVASITFDLAESFGVTFEHLQKVTKANGNLTPVSEAFLRGSRANRENLSPEHREFNTSQAGIGEKDLALAIDACREGSIDTRMMEVAKELLRSVMLGDDS